MLISKPTPDAGGPTNKYFPRNATFGTAPWTYSLTRILIDLNRQMKWTFCGGNIGLNRQRRPSMRAIVMG